MAAFDTTSRPVTALNAGSFTRVIANTFGALAAWNDERVTRNSLSKLTSRELEDIGLCYGDIDAIAKHAR